MKHVFSHQRIYVISSAPIHYRRKYRRITQHC